MKNLIFIFLLLAGSANATTYQFPIGTHTATVNSTIAAASNGDIIEFQRGGFWDSLITINNKTGLTFRAYGSGAVPIFNTRCRIPGSDNPANWTDAGGNKWWMALSSPQNVDYRIWVDSVELPKQYGPNITSARPVSYDTDWNKLYIYSTSNPATAFSLIEFPSENTATIWIVNSSYLTFYELDVRGSIGGSFDIHTSNNISITYCEIGWDANRMGVRAGTTGQNTDITVEYCTINSGDQLQDIYAISHGVSDGVWMAGGCHRWIVRRNLIKNWGHSCVEISNVYPLASDTTMSDILITENNMTAPDVDYCRGLALNSLINRTVTGVVVSYNWIHDMTIQTQLNVPNLVFKYNLITNIYRTSNPGFPLDDNNANGIQSAGNSNTWPYNMTITNNTIANCAGVGLYLARSAGYNPIEGCNISNNILYNNGTDVPTWFPSTGDYQICIVANDSATGKYFIGNNIMKNNLAYSSTAGDLVWESRHAANPYKTIAEFNSQSNGINGDQVAGNINSDPLFVAPSEDMYWLLSTSPARDAGITIAGHSTGLRSTSSWPLSVVTAEQSGTYEIGAYIYQDVTTNITIRGIRVTVQ